MKNKMRLRFSHERMVFAAIHSLTVLYQYGTVCTLVLLNKQIQKYSLIYAEHSSQRIIVVFYLKTFISTLYC